MTERRRRGWSVVMLGVGAFVLSAVAVGGMQTSDAAWIDDEHTTVTLGTATVGAPTSLSCVSSGGLLNSSIPFRWSPPASGPTPTSYTLRWSGSAGSGSFSTTGTSAVITGGLLTIGSAQVTVVANYENWQSPPSNTRTLSIVLILGWGCS